jgi:hypothetical protein
MSDGPSVEIRITADTGGVDTVNNKLGELRLQAEATRRSAQQLGADFRQLYDNTQKLGGGSAEAQAALRETAGYLAQTEGQARSAAAALRGELKNGLDGASGGMRNLGGELKHGIALIDEFSRGARGAMVGSLVAAARDSGYLGTAIAALKGPFGVALAGSAALAAGLYVLIERAHATETALRGVYNASLLMGGVSAGHAELGAKAAMTALGSSGVMGSSSADKYVAAVYKLGDASDSAKQKLAALGPALYLALDKDDKALEKFVDHFRDTSSLKSFAEAQGPISEAQARGFAIAVQTKDADTARAMVLDTLQKRLSGANAAIGQAGRTATSGLAAAMAAQSGVPPFSAESFLPGAATGQTRLPETPAGARPQAIQRAIEEETKYGRVALETAEIEANIADMTKRRAAAATDADRAHFDTLIKNAKDQAAALANKGGAGQPDLMEGLREKLKEQDAALASSAANAKAAHAAMHANDVQYWTQALAGDKLNAKERAEAQMELFSAKEASALGALPSGAGGGRGARAPSALATRGGGPEARSQYEDFAAGEREKIAAAAGSGAQIQAIYQEWAARAKAQFGDTSREYQNVLREMTAAAQREGQQQARAIAEASRQAYEQFAGAERDKIAAAQGSTSQILAIYEQWAAQAKAIFGEQSTQYEAVVRQMTDAANRASEQMQESFAKPFDSLGSSAERALTGLLTHQTTVGKAEQEAYRGLIGSSVDEVGDALNKSLASSLFGSKSLGEGLVGMLGIGKPGGLFGTGIGAVSADTSEATFATSVGTFSTAVGVFASAASTGGAASVAGGVGNVAGGVGGIGNFLASVPLIGSLFGASGAADQDFSGGIGIGGGGLFAGLGSLFGFKGGGIVPSFKSGGIMTAASYRLPSYAAGGVAIPGLAKLHENEMVLPSHISNFVQNAAAATSGGGGHGGASGDTHLHFHGPADGPAIERFLTPFIRRGVPGAVQNAFRSNALTPRTV